MAKATFAAGCFWGVEAAFRKIPGVTSTAVGYMGGTLANPTYEDVCTDRTGHAEVVQLEYDPAQVSYHQLLDLFWKNIDPTDAGGQFCDRGAEYRSAIFYHDEQQRIAAERSKEQVQKEFQEPVSTSVVTVASFTPAGEEHQDYYKKQPFRYKQYKMRCGREQRLRAIWK